jgi:hypothetical protein
MLLLGHAYLIHLFTSLFLWPWSLDIMKNYDISVKKDIVRLLITVLERSNDELLILTVSFLKKLSIRAENIAQMKSLGLAERLVPLLASANADLAGAVVRLALNLSFDVDMRASMLAAGALPKLVALMSAGEDENSAGAAVGEDEEEIERRLRRRRCTQNPVYCILYHFSMDDKVNKYVISQFIIRDII